MFFFEKKNQKTFIPCRVVAGRNPPGDKSFFASFFSKKEVLPSSLTSKLEPKPCPSTQP
jgi:hypothetical protein